jgi:hypothetical protein
MKWTRSGAQAIALSLCLIVALVVVIVRTTGSPHETRYGRYLQRFERTVDAKRIFQPNPHPDLIAAAYRRTVGAGEAEIATRGTDAEKTGSLSYAGSGIVWLSQGSGQFTTHITGQQSGTSVVRIVRNNSYIDRLQDGSRHWVGLPRNFAGPLNFPAENFAAPLFSLQYLSVLHTPVHRGTVTGPGITPCQGLVTAADENGGTRSLLTSIGVCLDSAGRISVASFGYAYQSPTTNSREALTITLDGFGLHQAITDPTGVRNPFVR